ncbi:MAG: sigma-70 family RNA polymerase sigma factor [Proteobacteria bacterium]|nr:sigma-70 family RNA polymerase sigma factor [Pseudomonadota bacterium]
MRSPDRCAHLRRTGAALDALDAYMSGLSARPTLPHGEMMELFKSLEGGDESSRERLIEANLRLVVSIARSYGHSKIPLEDLIQEGNIGLMKAVERFDWKKGFRFSTYATWWIRQAVGQYVAKRKRIIRVPSHAVGAAKRAADAVAEYRKEFGTDPTEQELAELSGSSAVVLRAAGRHRSEPVSLSAPAGPDGEGEVGDRLQDEAPDPFERLAASELTEVTRSILSTLTQKEVAVVRLRFGLVEDPEDSESYPITEEELAAARCGEALK